MVVALPDCSKGYYPLLVVVVVVVVVEGGSLSPPSINVFAVGIWE